MSLSDSDIKYLNLTFYFVIILCIFQVLTMVSMVILVYSFIDMKKKLHKYNRTLPLVQFTQETQSVEKIPSVIYNSETPSPVPKRMVALGNTQKAEINEVIEVLPTPNRKRRNIIPPPAVDQNEQSRPNMLRHDSGLGSGSERNPSSSSDTLKEIARRSAELARRSMEGDSTRTVSNASTTTFASRTTVTSPGIDDACALGIDDTDFEMSQQPLSRLQTMAIEQIDVEPLQPSEKRHKRASMLNDKINEEDEPSFINRGFSDAREISRSELPLASEKCSPLSVDNTQDNVSVYENQDIVDQHNRKYSTSL